MSALKRQIILVLIAQAVSTFGSHENIDLLKLGHMNLTNSSGASSPEDLSSLESGLKSTVFTVFNDLDEIFKHLLDFPLFYSVPKPTFKNIYKTYDENSSENYMGISGTSITTGESEAFDIAYESLLSSTESEMVSKNRKSPNELALDLELGTKHHVIPAKRAYRSRRTVTSDVSVQKNHSYEYVVLIRNKADKEFKQTGVALSEYLVLTAASGLTDTQGRLCEPSQLSIYSQLPNGTESKELPVVNIYQNPHFVPSDIAKHEIALLEVINPGNMSHSYPSLANENNQTLPTSCSVFTWNVPKKYFSKPGQEIPHLERQDVVLSDPVKCKQLLSDFNESNSYCSVIKDSPHPFMNHLGAPLICSGELFGFVGGTGTKTKGLDLFTRISQYNLFIENNKEKSFKRFSDKSWRAKELYDVKSSADFTQRPNMKQLVTSPLIAFIVVGFHYIL